MSKLSGRFQTEQPYRVRFFSDHLPRLGSHDFVLVDRKSGFQCSAPKMTFDGGEKAKSWKELERILDTLFSKNITRSDRLVVVGGGALLDLGALAASLYKRGIPLVLVPTTLLSMVDASVGGKTAIDHQSSGIKNFAGTFYPAGEVWIQPNFLKTLSHRERLSGVGECLKMILLFGESSVWFRELVGYANGLETSKLLEIIKFCVKKKISVVEKDPFDRKRIRESLNYGHTIGHALEAMTNGKISHGEAIFWGMAVESLLAGKNGKKLSLEILALAKEMKLKLPPALTVSSVVWRANLQRDKKWKKGKVEITVAQSLGRAKKMRVSSLQLVNAVKNFANLVEFSKT